VDPQGPAGRPISLAPSGAIALYLAERAGRFIPSDPTQRVITMQWFMFAMTDLSPASANLFLLVVRAPEKSPANLAWLDERLLRYARIADASEACGTGLARR
jgi:glutathione S-transferase